MWWTLQKFLSVCLVLSRLLFRVIREKVCSHMYVDTNKLILAAWCFMRGNLVLSKNSGRGRSWCRLLSESSHWISITSICICSSTSDTSTENGVVNSFMSFSMTEKSWKRLLNSAWRDLITDTYFILHAERLTFGKAVFSSNNVGKCTTLKLKKSLKVWAWHETLSGVRAAETQVDLWKARSAKHRGSFSSWRGVPFSFKNRSITVCDCFNHRVHHTIHFNSLRTEWFLVDNAVHFYHLTSAFANFSAHHGGHPIPLASHCWGPICGNSTQLVPGQVNVINRSRYGLKNVPTRCGTF